MADPKKPQEEIKEKDSGKKGGHGLCWFILIVVILIIGYFILFRT